jgi:hypothetical protein
MVSSPAGGRTPTLTESHSLVTDEIHAFEVVGMTPERFLEAVRGALARADLPARVDARLEGEQMVVRLSRLGTTVLRYDLVRSDGGFRADMVSERVAPLHAPFRAGYRDAMAHLLREVGARTGR